MLGNLGVYAAILCAVGVVAAGIFAFPPLIPGGPGVSTGMTEAEYDTLLRREVGYCRNLPGRVDCACFARVSGMIQSHDAPKVPDARHADRQELARGQAKGSC